MLVAFKGACVGACTDGARLLGNNDDVITVAGEVRGGGSLALWGMWLVAAPIDLIIAGDVIVIAIVVVVIVLAVISHNVAAEGGFSMAIPPLLSTLSTSPSAAALFSPLNLRRSTLHRPTPTLCGAHLVYHHHCPPVCAPPHYLLLPPPTLVDC